LGVDEGEEDKLIAFGIVNGVVGDTLHGKQIAEGHVSVHVKESYEARYKIYEPVNLDNPPILLVGKAVGHFILWPT